MSGTRNQEGCGCAALIALALVIAVPVWLVTEALELVGLKDEPGEGFARACEGLGGTVTVEELECKVTYRGQQYEVPLDNESNRLDPDRAREAHRACRDEARYARESAAFEHDGRMDRFIYHGDTGVCERHENAVRIRRRPEPEAPPLPQPPQETAPTPAQAEDCAEGYEPCVPPYPPDVDCPDVDGPVSVTGDDPHGLDRDGDGTGCE